MSRNVAVVGTGMMGRIHADAFRRAGARVIAVAGSTIPRAAAASSDWAQDAEIRDFDRILADPAIDLVTLCVPNAQHVAMSAAVIRAGKHLVCEKPLATSLRDADALVELAEAAGIVAAVPFVYRYHPLVAEARERISNGEAGRIHLVHGSYLQDWLSAPGESNWRVDRAAGGDSRAFADIGSHWCDIVEFVTGLTITEVSAMTHVAFGDRMVDGAARGVTTEDIACVNLRFSNGAVGSVVVSQVSPGRKNRLTFEISGDQATVAFDQERPESMFWGRRDRAEIVLRDPRTLGAEAAALSTLPAGHPMGYNDCFHAFARDTLAAIQGDHRSRLPTFRDGHRAVAITQAVLASARSSMWQPVTT